MEKLVKLAKSKGFISKVIGKSALTEHNSNKEIFQLLWIQEAIAWLNNEQAIFIDVNTDTTINEVLGYTYTIKSWKFTPIDAGGNVDGLKGIKTALELALNQLKDID